MVEVHHTVEREEGETKSKTEGEENKYKGRPQPHFTAYAGNANGQADHELVE